MVAIMNEALELETGHKILEVGSGSGWHAATIAEIVAPNNVAKDKWGHVYTIELVPSLARSASEKILKNGYGERVTVVIGDGSEGYLRETPYDRILVTAAAPKIPGTLRNQLRSRGIMVIPVGDVGYYQALVRIRRSDGIFAEEDLGGVAFVPLLGKFGHKSS